MKKSQLNNRLAPPMVREVLAQFRNQEIKVDVAANRLGLSPSGFYNLYSKYLVACAQGGARSYVPGVSGGDHAAAWPNGVMEMLRQRLTADPPYSFAFAASEAGRLLDFRLDRAQVRLWALQEKIVKPKPKRPVPFSRRWQRTRVGELWQMDATPYRWFGPETAMLPMINMLDDCSRFQVGGQIYAHERHPAYLHFIETAFRSHGLPLQIYVDHAGAFFEETPGAATRLQENLRFYDVSFLYAPTPQAKGKIERNHQVWLDRIPALLAFDHITDLEAANAQVQSLIYQRNHHESHREIGMTPSAAWRLAQQEERVCLRPVPACPWWPYVWSDRSKVRVGPNRKVNIGTRKVSVNACAGAWIIKCTHVDGHTSLLAAPPKTGMLPSILFTDRPK